MNVHFLKATEKKELLAALEQQFGITELPYLLIETGKEKIRAFSGSLSKEEMLELDKIINIELIGLYMFRKEHDLRISFDATQLLSPHLKKNIVDINDDYLAKWMRGHDLDIQAQHGTLLLRHGTDFVGCGKSSGNRIANHVPKERRLKNKP